MKTKIDINEWDRKLAFETFSKYDDPYTGIVSKIDITALVEFCKKNKYSFYGCMTYFILKSLNDIAAFKYGYGKEYDLISKISGLSKDRLMELNECNGKEKVATNRQWLIVL